MMQKRKSYLSLLLASFLLLFTFSLAAAQNEISFEERDVPRCVTADQSVYVTSDVALGAFEVIFEVSGHFDSYTFTVATLSLTTSAILDGNKVRVFGYMGDNAGDACLPIGTTTIGTLHFVTSDLCSGAITVASATVDDPFTHGSLFVGCDPIEEIAPTFTVGTGLTIKNQAPEITYCPVAQNVHFGTVIIDDAVAVDADACELLQFSLPGNTTNAAIDPLSGHLTWSTVGTDVGAHVLTVRVTDKCGEYVECTIDICIYNTPPLFGSLMWAGWKNDADVVINVTGDVPVTDVIYTTLGIELIGGVNAVDQGPTLGPNALSYSVLSFNGPTTNGTGLYINSVTGEWSWDIAAFDMAYTGDFELCLLVDDGANISDPACSDENADTLCLDIHVTGHYVDIEDEDGSDDTKSHGAGIIQGTTATVSIDLNGSDPIGGFDFLVAYDASALAALNVLPGAALTDAAGDLEEFEYFTYRFVDGCGGGCPTGLLRIVGMKETNDGITNPNADVSNGVLADMNFHVTSNLTFECQFVPIRFYWRDCGDNTLSDLTGNFLYLANQVIDPIWGNIINDGDFGYYGPAADCYDVVQAGDPAQNDPFKGPLGAIIFENGGIKIICIRDIDDRGDVNLNGIDNEVADAVVFTNYFVVGIAAFTINVAGQTAATDINGDGTPLSVADLVYLIRIIVGDALPISGNLAKLTPSDPITIGYNGSIVDLRGTTDVGAALFVFDNQIIPTLTDNANHMTIQYGYIDGMTQVIVYNMEHHSFSAGNVLSIEGDANLVGVQAADNFGAPLDVEKTIVVPTEFALLQNYPNPFNPETVIGLALPVASNWSISIYNVSGQLVKEFAGYSEAGTIQVTWDATDVASGLYFYKAMTDTESATKKMVLLK